MAPTISSLFSSSWPMNVLELGQHRPRVALAAVEGLVELAGDRLELGHAAAVEQQARARRGPPRPPGCGRSRSSGITSPSPSRPVLASGRRRGQRDELLAEQAGLPDLGDRVVGQLDVVAELQGDLGVVAVEPDVVDLADGDVVDLDRRLRHQVEHVAELDLDGHRVVAEVGAAGQRQAVDGEVAAAQQHRDDEQRRTSARPAWRFIAATSRSAERRSNVAVDGDACPSGDRRPAARAGACLITSHSSPERCRPGRRRCRGTSPGRRSSSLSRSRRCWPRCPACRSAGCRCGTGCQRRRRDLQDLVEGGALLDQHLRHPVEALDVVRERLAGSPSRTLDTADRDAEVVQRRPRGRSRSSLSRSGRRGQRVVEAADRAVVLGERVDEPLDLGGRCRTAPPCCRRACR